LYPHLHIGEGTAINHSCHFDLNAPIYIGKNVGIGNNVFISTSTHIIGDSEQRCSKLILKPVTIGDGSWVGAYVIILAGVTIGPGTVVAAGSVVTKDIPANAQVAGNPARVIGWLNKASEDEQ
jgi:acetyltransferase-like isoleucine patch superfamily enzyme